MSVRRLRGACHWPSVFGSLLHFEVSFAVWMLLGVLAPFVALELSLSPAAGAVVVALPLLSGAAFRVILGVLGDTYGPRRVGTLSMLAVAVPLAWAGAAAQSLPELLGVGVLLGIAGGSFALTLPLVAHNTAPDHRGLALGIAGAGNSGTVLAALVAPRVAERVGWRPTMLLAVIPVLAAAALFRLVTAEVPDRVREPLTARFAPLRRAECWRLCALYAVTFGGFAGLAAYLPTMLVDRYALSPVAAAGLGALAAGSGSALRPVGGVWADRYGGERVLRTVYLVASAAAIFVAFGPPLRVGAPVLVVLLAVLGVGNGAVFEIVPRLFSRRVGVVVGIVGAAGGVGAFLLPTVLGVVRDLTGSYGGGFVVFAGAALLAAGSLRAFVPRVSPVPATSSGEMT